MFRYPYKKLSAQERLRLHLAATFDPPMSPEEAKERGLPPPEGTSYELDSGDLPRPPRVTSGSMLNSSGKPTSIKKLLLGKETLAKLDFPKSPDHKRVFDAWDNMRESGKPQCNDEAAPVVEGERGTKLLWCKVAGVENTQMGDQCRTFNHPDRETCWTGVRNTG